MPRSFQIMVRGGYVRWKRDKYKPIWPIDPASNELPEGWLGWPHGKRFALVLTHDVESAWGHEKCFELAQLEEKMGFRSCFNFVAEDYEVSPRSMQHLKERGFEVGVHGLHHKGNPFQPANRFKREAIAINRYLSDWDAVGFRSPCMYHDLDMIADLDILWDSSTFDTDPFEPQPDGMGTIFPFWVHGKSNCKRYLELPYTLPQDFTIFVLMKHNSIDIWKQKLDWIVQNGGMALLITHPDYMDFSGEENSSHTYPSNYYQELLQYLRSTYAGGYWNALPKDLVAFWSNHIAPYAIQKKSEEVAKSSQK